MRPVILFGTAFATSASAATTITGSVTGLNYQTTDPGLGVSATAIAFPSFTLNNVNDFADFDVLNIGTTEGTVNIGEDTNPSPISVTFTFTDPAGTSGAAVTGTTFGFIIPFTTCGIIAGGCGRVDFGAPTNFTFGNGGQFSVQLSDATFGTPGNANVSARFTLLAESVAPPVPEPATWAMMLVGFGAVGFSMRRRRRATVTYATA